MRLVRDLLDQLVADRHGRLMGRVDRIVIAVGDSSPPRVVAVVIGASSLGDRLGAAVGRWTAGLLHALDVDAGQPLRIDVHDILEVADKVRVDVAFTETAAANVERQARRLVGSIPGAHR